MKRFIFCVTVVAIVLAAYTAQGQNYLNPFTPPPYIIQTPSRYGYSNWLSNCYPGCAPPHGYRRAGRRGY